MDAVYTILSLADPLSTNPVVREIGTFCYLIIEAMQDRQPLGQQSRVALERIRRIERTTWEQCCEVPQHEVLDKFERLLRRLT